MDDICVGILLPCITDQSLNACNVSAYKLISRGIKYVWIFNSNKLDFLSNQCDFLRHNTISELTFKTNIEDWDDFSNWDFIWIVWECQISAMIFKVVNTKR